MKLSFSGSRTICMYGRKKNCAERDWSDRDDLSEEQQIAQRSEKVRGAR